MDASSRVWQNSSPRAPLIEGHWLNILLPLSAYRAKEAVIFNIIESLFISILLGISLKSWWLFVGGLLFSNLLLNFGMITRRNNLQVVAIFIISIGCTLSIVLFLSLLFPELTGWIATLCFLVFIMILFVNTWLFSKYSWIKELL